jgi:hypothetical protein
MAIEMSVFDPDSIQVALDRDLAGGLRMLAEALETGAMTGRCLGAEGVGSKHGDASVLVRIVVSAPVKRFTRVQDVRCLDVGQGLEKVG